MRIAYLTFSNSQQAPLPTLQEEDDSVHKTLAQRDVAHHFRLHRDSFSTIPKIAEYLLLFQEQIALFHFSGHAGRDQLLLDDSAANASGIAQLLARCPNLQLVVLNGCSTKGQVSALLEAGVPVVIATSAPVKDRTAAQFAISFYQSLADRFKSIGEAFEDGIAAAQTQSGQAIKVERTRGALVLSDVQKDEPLWGLHCREESDLDWKLPLGSHAAPPDYKPNVELIEQLIDAIAPYDAEAKKIKQQEDLGVEVSAGEKKKAILRSLPHPVSQQLRKLMSKEKGMGEDHLFFDRPGAERLRQMSYTYSTLVELLAFILLAELWEALDEKEGQASLQIPPGSLDTVKSFFNPLPGDKKPFDFVALIRSIRLVLEQNELPFFVEELKDLSRIFNEDTEFASACRYLEAIRQQFARQGSPGDEEAAQLCPLAENKLATVFGALGFLARYSLSSVRHINDLKFRYPPAALFNHKVIRLKQEFLELEEGQEIMNNYLHAASVIIQRRVHPDFLGDSDGSRFLNLSPFVIDESAFDEKAELAKLFFFERYEKSLDAQRYRHVYKPGDLPLV
ncbi:MAG: CHAT domain-containing protein, partial [Bacteroidota bacterium]